jgi:CubicO group peptidase (beta-lactamase class C family)
MAATPPANTRNPGKAWERFANPEAAGFRTSALEALEHTLYSKPTTSLMVVKTGKVVYSYGDTAQVSYLASARKSVLSMLYGKYVANGTIDLKRTIGDLGINENGEGLLAIEKTATIRDLLMSSSGVYWPAGSPGGDEATPPRGSKTPGAYFHYNNWDFNVAGAVFQQLTGKTVFRALQEDLATPLQFQDFDPARQRMLGYQGDPSRYNA